MLGVYEQETYVSEHPIYLTQFTDDQFGHLETYTIENLGATPLPLGENLAITTYTIENMEEIHCPNLGIFEPSHRTRLRDVEETHDPNIKDCDEARAIGENLEITTYTIMGPTNSPNMRDNNVGPILLMHMGNEHEVGEETHPTHEQESIQEISLENQNMEEPTHTANIEDKDNRVNYEQETKELSHEQESINRLENEPNEFQRKILTKKQKKELLKSNNNNITKQQQIMGKSTANIEQQGINKHIQGVKRRLNNSDENQKKTEAVVASTSDERDVIEQFGRMKIMQELNKTLGQNNVALEEGIMHELGKTLGRKSAIEEEINKILDNAQRESNSGGRNDRNSKSKEYEHKGESEREKITFQTLLMENAQQKERSEREKMSFQTLVREKGHEKSPSGRHIHHNKPSNMVKYDVFEKEFKITDNDKRVIEEYLMKRNQRRALRKEMRDIEKDKMNSKEKTDKVEDNQNVSNEIKTGTLNEKQTKNIHVNRDTLVESYATCSHTQFNCPAHGHRQQTEPGEEVEQQVVPVNKPQKRNRRRQRNRRQEAKAREQDTPSEQTNETRQSNGPPPGHRLDETGKISSTESGKKGRKVPRVDISPTNIQQNKADRIQQLVGESPKQGRKSRETQKSDRRGRNVLESPIEGRKFQPTQKTNEQTDVRDSAKNERKAPASVQVSSSTSSKVFDSDEGHKEGSSKAKKTLNNEQSDKEGNGATGKSNLKRVEYTRDSLIITFNEKDGTLKIVPRVENGVLVRKPEEEGAQDGEHSKREPPNQVMSPCTDDNSNIDQYTKSRAETPQKEMRCMGFKKKIAAREFQKNAAIVCDGNKNDKKILDDECKQEMEVDHVDDDNGDHVHFKQQTDGENVDLNLNVDNTGYIEVEGNEVSGSEDEVNEETDDNSDNDADKDKEEDNDERQGDGDCFETLTQL
uniref:Uncharacterized protein n=1 Tax=Cacopsylla melanoneura TaxID=428564 RepID=A0A8D8XWL7_9HEMI